VKTTRRIPTAGLLSAACSFFLCAFSGSAAPGPGEKPDIVLHITTAVKADGSGDLTIAVTLSQDARAFLESLPDFPGGKICDEFTLDAEGGAEWTEQENDGALTCTSAIPFADLEELETLIMEQFDGVNFSRLETAGGRFYYDLAGEMGSSLSVNTELDFNFEAWWIVVVPGEVVLTNADESSGRTLTWNLLTLGSPSRLQAESKIGGASEPDPALLAAGAAALLGCCCVIVLIAGGAGFFLLRNRLRGIPHPAKAG
jgi:hypothetical protein